MDDITTGVETVETADTSTDAGAAEATSTAPEAPGWLSRVQGLEADELEAAKGYFDKALVTVKHGKTGQELPLPMSELLNLAEQGFDAQSKTQAAAEALRLHEWYQQNQAQVDAAMQLAQYLQTNPMAAQQFAQVAQRFEPQAFGGYQPQTQQEAAMYARLQQLEQAEAERAQSGQQAEFQAKMQEVAKKLENDANSVVMANPHLFDVKTAGPTAQLNLYKFQQEMAKVGQSGYYNDDLVDYTFHKLFGKQLEKQAVTKYLNTKTNQAPSVSAGGTPAGRGKQTLTKDDYFARGRARLMGGNHD